ncbi:UNVERIFIED_ORG: hypothetical protein LHK14_18115 [Roseateles sp. XES5]|nr:hypothetical protein [Roseateles sp. XES5]
MSIKYKKTPPPRLAVVGTDTPIGGPKTAARLEGEDNYEIQVWESEGGAFLGYALKTSLRLAVQACWKEAIAQYPGRYLAQTNGPYELRAVVAPDDKPDAHGEISSDEMYLDELPQWWTLVGQCVCGKKSPVDRYDPAILRWKGWPLRVIAEKLDCQACKNAGRPRGKIKIRLERLPR